MINFLLKYKDQKKYEIRQKSQAKILNGPVNNFKITCTTETAETDT